MIGILNTRLEPATELGLFHASLGLCFINYTNDRPADVQVYAVAKDYYFEDSDGHDRYLEAFNRAFHHLNTRGEYNK